MVVGTVEVDCGRNDVVLDVVPGIRLTSNATGVLFLVKPPESLT